MSRLDRGLSFCWIIFLNLLKASAQTTEEMLVFLLAIKQVVHPPPSPPPSPPAALAPVLLFLKVWQKVVEVVWGPLLWSSGNRRKAQLRSKEFVMYKLGFREPSDNSAFLPALKWNVI